MQIYSDGPWEVIKHSEECGAVRIGDIVVEGAYRGGESDTLSLADAQLISASPELAKAAHLALHSLLDADVAQFYPEVEAALRAALAKANVELDGWVPPVQGKDWSDYPLGTKARVRGEPGYYTRIDGGWGWLDQRFHCLGPYGCNEFKLPKDEF